MDFSSLINDPQAMYGMALLGAARSSTSPFADAQKQVYAMQKQAADIALMQAQQQRMSQMTVNERQQQAIALQNFMLQRGIMNKVGNLPALGGAGVPAEQLPPPTAGLPQSLLDLLPPQGAASGLTQQVQQGMQPTPNPMAPSGGTAAPPETPQMSAIPTGKYGTPLPILHGVMMNESSGNPQAVNPTPLASGKHAMGLYGWDPDTVDMLHKQGIQFNPMIGNQANHDAADFYLNQLVTKHGGWGDPQAVQAGLNDFQGAQKTVGSAANLKYNARALAGMNTTMQGTPPPAQSAPTQATPPQASLPNTGVPLIQAGGMLGMINPAAGNTLVEAGKALAPTNVTANATRVDPITGKVMLTGPSAKEKQEIANMTPGPTGITPADISKNKLESDRQFAGELMTNWGKFRKLPNDITAWDQAKASIPPAMYTGPAADRKIALVKFINNTFNTNFDAAALTNADTFKSQIVIPLLDSVATTGGRMSTVEIGKMTSKYGSLETDPKAMRDIIDIMSQEAQNTIGQHNDLVKQAKINHVYMPVDLTINPNPAPTVGPAGRQNAIGSNPANLGVGGPAVAKAAPPVGTVSMGRVFMGGNPADPKSWVTTPGGK